MKNKVGEVATIIVTQIWITIREEEITWEYQKII